MSKVLPRKKPASTPKKPQDIHKQIKNLNQSVASLAEAFVIELSSIRTALDGKRGLQQMIGDHIMVDIIQQAWRKEVPVLSAEEKWNRMVHAVESAIEEYKKEEKPEWTSSEDIHKVIQYLNASVNY